MAKANIGSLKTTLVNTDNINLLWKNINILKNNIKNRSHVSGEADLEVNIDKIKYSFINVSTTVLRPWPLLQFRNTLHSQ
jgi:hypothetical protein